MCSLVAPSVETIDATVQCGGGVLIRSIGARIRLRQGEGAHRLAGCQTLQPGGALRGGAELRDDLGDQ